MEIRRIVFIISTRLTGTIVKIYRPGSVSKLNQRKPRPKFSVRKIREGKKAFSKSAKEIKTAVNIIMREPQMDVLYVRRLVVIGKKSLINLVVLSRLRI